MRKSRIRQIFAIATGVRACRYSVPTLFVAFLLCLAPIAMAQDLPAAYRVAGVAADDVLNIRSGPGVNHPIVGELGPYATHVEVLALSGDGGWGKVSTGEGNGWVAMRFLRALPVEPHAIPRPLTCIGTEPFWALGLDPRGATYNSPETGARQLIQSNEAVAPQGYFAAFREGAMLEHRLLIMREICSDGMSDREYGFSASLFIEAPEGNELRRGCCTLELR